MKEPSNQHSDIGKGLRMKKSMTLSTIAAIVFVVLSINVGIALAAYELDWVSIQHRVYEDRTSQNVLAFNLKDGAGDYVSESNSVTNVILRYPQPNGDPDPTGTPVQLNTLLFFPLFDYVPARFDTDSAQWIYDPPYLLSEFDAEIEGTLVTGTYTLEVTTDDWVTHTKTINFDEILNLPIISSRTFQIHTDLNGNISWTWDIPKELLELAETYDLVVRAGVFTYKNEEIAALSWPNMPVHVGFCFIPASVYNFLKSKGDSIKFSLNVRTNDGLSKARAYSKSTVITDLNAPVSIIPKNGVVVVPLF
jgi:hypothetical protein